MKKETFFISAIVVLFLFNVLTLAYVLFGLKKDNHPFPPVPPQVINAEERLNLNPDQRKQFNELKIEHRSQMEVLQNISRELHDKCLDILKTRGMNNPEMESILKEIGSNQIEMDKVTFTHFEKLKELCNPEQMQLYIQFIDEITRSLKPPMPPKGGPPEGR